MPITVQQFDYIASLQGLNAALAVAEQTGGVTGTRDAGPTQIATNPYGGQSLTPSVGGSFPGVTGTLGSESIGEATPAGSSYSPAPPRGSLTDGGIAVVVNGVSYGTGRFNKEDAAQVLRAQGLGERDISAALATVAAPATQQQAFAEADARAANTTPAGGGYNVNLGQFGASSAGGQPQQASPERTYAAVLETFLKSGRTEADIKAFFQGLLGLGYSSEHAQLIVNQQQAVGAAGSTGLLGKGKPPGADILDPFLGGGDPLLGAGGQKGLIGALGGGGGVYNPKLREKADALLNQPNEEVFRRVGEEIYGGSNPLRRRLLDNLISRFEEFSPIMQFGQFGDDPTVENQFRSFATSSRPTGAQLGTEMARLLETADPTVFQDVFGMRGKGAEGSFGREIGPAFQFGIAPFRESFTPSLRPLIGRELEEQFRSRYAQDPTQFPDAASVFRELQRRKYLPAYRR